MNVAILEKVSKLDLKTPFDELSELRAVLTTQEIAELTGLRRETISRARPDGRFQRRTEKAVGDLYLVVTRMRSLLGGDLDQLAAVLRRPQEELAGRSIAALLKEGRVDVVLEHLVPPEPTAGERLEDLRLSPEVEAELTARRRSSPAELARSAGPDERMSALLAADPELDSRLGAIEAAILAHFGPDARIERQIIEPHDVPGGRDQLYLRIHTSLSAGEEIDRLGEFLGSEEALLAPVKRQLTLGFLG